MIWWYTMLEANDARNMKGIQKHYWPLPKFELIYPKPTVNISMFQSTYQTCWNHSNNSKSFKQVVYKKFSFRKPQCSLNSSSPKFLYVKLNCIELHVQSKIVIERLIIPAFLLLLSPLPHSEPLNAPLWRSRSE